MSLLNDFLQYIRDQKLLSGEEKKTLLAVSGGVDSVVLGHLFKEAGLRFAVAHCNFGLRGADSDADAAFVRALAKEWSVPYMEKRFDTLEFVREQGVSTQMAARELRYKWFGSLAAEHDFGQVATAHHLNDSVETALFNLARGSGWKGLSGMAPKKSMEKMNPPFTLIRPLLFARKETLLHFAETMALSWREDRSNETDVYSRNFVRHHILPLFEQINPDFLHTVSQNMSGIKQDGENLEFLLNHFLNISETGGIRKLEKKKIEQLPHPARALYAWMRPFGFDFEQVRQVAGNLQQIGMEWQSETGIRLLVERDCLLVQAVSTHTTEEQVQIYPDDLMLRLPGGGSLFQTSFHNGEMMPDGKVAVVVDADKLIFPLVLRHWQPGDVFQPFGMGGKRQKLQDFFTNQKISRWEKAQVWVLINGNGEIIWVLGWRLDERYGIHSKTKNAKKIHWIK